MLCCGYTLTDFPISLRLTSLALWQSNDCPSASKATLMNMDKYFMWIHYERLHNHNKAKHNKTVCIFLGIYCIDCDLFLYWLRASPSQFDYKRLEDVIKLCTCNLCQALAFILSQGGWIHISSLDHWDQHNMLITAGEAMVNIHILLNKDISHWDVSACHKIYGPPFYVLCYDCKLATLKC